MKISKVDHTRSGVGKRKTDIQGMLYQNPPKEGGASGLSVENRVKQLAVRSRSLYQLLGNSRKTDTNTERLYRKIRTYLNELTRVLLREYREQDTAEAAADKQSEILSTLTERRIFEGKWGNAGKTVEELSFNWTAHNRVREPETVVDELVYGSLRSSMKKTVTAADGNKVFLPEVIAKLVLALCSGKNYQKIYSQIPEREILVFLREMNKDYHKDKQISDMVNSIEKQNVRVQIVREGDQVLLRPANAAHAQKKYIFEFLKDYASADLQGRKAMMIHFRQLILLYYCGHETYERSADGDLLEWSFGALLPDADQTFSEEALQAFSQSLECGRRSAEYRRLCLQIKENIRRTNADCYRRSIAEPGLTPADRFWLRFIEQQTEKVLVQRREWDSMLLSQAYLCQKIFTDWVSYISMKFTDMGKAVFHFAMPKGEDLLTAGSFGEVLPEYQDGITSFDYERVKAEESLEQRISTAVSFAIGNYDRAVRDNAARSRKNREDILQLLNSEKQLEIRDDAYTRLMQFFGGKSRWKDSYIGELYDDPHEVKSLITAIGRTLNRIRNASFHYTGQWVRNLTEAERESQDIVREMFDWEYDFSGKLIRRKYYVNNALMFYSAKDMESMIRQLYAKPALRPPQIPAFGRILNKASLKEFAFVKGDPEKKLYNSGSHPLEVMDQFRNCLLFILKEIYYYDFLQADDLKKRFLDALEDQGKNEEARKNLKERIHELDRDETISFGALCQGIMTDFNLQNRGMKKIANENSKGQEDKIYKHFRTLLYIGIRKAFRTYLKEHAEKYEFLRSPRWRENWAESISEEDFCAGEPLPVFDAVKKSAEKTPDLLDWYVTAHFLNQRKLNQLIGTIKNYITFLDDINTRAAITGNRTNPLYAKKQREYYEQVLDILDFSRLFCEQISNQLTDYFADEKDYETYLLHYVDWRGSHSLQGFCDERVAIKGSAHTKIGIYYDGKNPIMNRNIILSRMYGNEDLLFACSDSISKDEIIRFYKDELELTGKNVFRNGICSREEEQVLLRDYQNQKNRIELNDLGQESELVNDLMSQLRVWCYMRERDMMYFQLGFHYIALCYGNEKKEYPWLDALKTDDRQIVKGAVLYQIMAMYTYQLPLYAQNGQNCEAKGTGKKVAAFVRDYCGGNEDVYKAGLCFFEKLGKNDSEHGRLVTLRNHIDHFHYEVTLEKSIMELYQEMFESFLRHDPNLRKNVPVVLQNILLEYFMIIRLDFSKHLAIAPEKEGKIPSVRSDLLTFKLYQIKNGKTTETGENVKVPARSERFTKSVRKILEYRA